jgi:N-acetylglucosamine-6-phosphate deacetylase
MSAHALRGHILTPGGWVDGELRHDGRDILAIDGQPETEAQARAATDGRPLLLPGFIDLHVHGGGGRDTMDGADAVAVMARTHLRHGTTALLATTMTAPPEDLEQALRALAPWVAQRPSGGARVLGVHLEGPFISPGRLGAQPDYARVASIDELRRLHALAPIRVVTVAPEQDEHLALVGHLVAEGFRVQLGHSAAGYEDGLAALQAGAHGFTHLFNAMSGLHHRAPGLVGAALAHAQHAEIIPDLLHVHPGAIRAALRCIPGLFAVTDSTSAAGMPDGEYGLGRHRVFKCLGGVRLADGTLAGSALTMDQALRNLVSLGLDLAQASARTATCAADYLGLPELGRLAPGARADVLSLDRSLRLRGIHIEGETIEFADA